MDFNRVPPIVFDFAECTMASLTADKMLSDAKKVAGRLKERTVLSDSLIMEAEYVNEHLVTLQSVRSCFF